MQIPGFDTIILFGIGLFVLYFLGRVLLLPGKWMLRLFLNAILGAMCIALINLTGDFLHIHIALNPFNAFIIGVFGVPGVVLVFLLQILLIG